MNDPTEIMDELLKKLDEKRWISLSKDSPGEVFKARNKLEAYDLIERQSEFSWRLTKDGFRAVELGGFEAWKAKYDPDPGEPQALNTAVDISNQIESLKAAIDNLGLGQEIIYDRIEELGGSSKKMNQKDFTTLVISTLLSAGLTQENVDKITELIP